MKLRSLFLLNLTALSVISASAQPKASIESVEVFDKKNQLVLPAVIQEVGARTSYASVYLYDSITLPSEIYVKVIRPEAKAENADFLIQTTTTYPKTGRFQIDRLILTVPNSKKEYYFARFSVKSTSDLCIKDKEGNVLKTFVIADNEMTQYCYCRVGEEFKMVPESEFQIMLKSPADYKLSGHTTLQDLNIDLVSRMVASIDTRDTKEKNLDFVRNEIKSNTKSISSAIADLLFAKTSLNGFLQPGFKMHVLKKSSVKHYGEIDIKTTELKSLLTDWGRDIDNGDVQAKLGALATEFEQLGDAATDVNVRILCYANASLGYTVAREFGKAKIARKLAQESDKSWFGVVGMTTPYLYEYIYKRDAILATDTINYRTLVSESEM